MSDDVELGIIWVVVFIFIALVILGRFWYRDRKLLNELREQRVWQQHILNDRTWQIHDRVLLQNSPPPSYHVEDYYEMDQFDQDLGFVHDEESQRPRAPERVVLRPAMGRIF